MRTQRGYKNKEEANVWKIIRFHNPGIIENFVNEIYRSTTLSLYYNSDITWYQLLPAVFIGTYTTLTDCHVLVPGQSARNAVSHRSAIQSSWRSFQENEDTGAAQRWMDHMHVCQIMLFWEAIRWTLVSGESMKINHEQLCIVKR